MSAKQVKSSGIRGVGMHCHQCRQKSRKLGVACENLREKNKPCMVKLCIKCLFNRYGEKVEEIAEMEKWICPKCRGICNCSVCMKQIGHKPIGRLSKAAKATGFSSSEKSFDGQLGSLNDSWHAETSSTTHTEIMLPLGTDLTSVAGIHVPADDVGNALEFLEFSSIFGKILKMKNGEAEYILQEIFHGRPRKRCPIVQFQMHLLSIIKTEQGEKSAKPSGKNRWFDELKICLAGSQCVVKALGVAEAADYEALNASEKLRLLNLLCVEVLGMRKLRRWIEGQNTQLERKAKEAKQMVKTLKQKMKDDIESVDQTADAVRIEPVFASNYSGHVYWKLNCSGESDVLHQYVGKGDTLTLNEKWSALSAEEKQVLENNISERRMLPLVASAANRVIYMLTGC